MSSQVPSIKDLKPGIRPVGPRVLVYPIPVEEKSSGGIVLIKSLTEREDMAQVQALVVDLGLEAFSDVLENWANVGDTVLIAKYAGLYWTGEDGLKYRVINDADVVAVIEPEGDPLDQVVKPVGIASEEGVHNG